MPDETPVTATEQAQAHDRASARHASAHPAGHKHDETVPGGRYVVGGQLVDADAKPVKDKP